MFTLQEKSVLFFVSFVLFCFVFGWALYKSTLLCWLNDSVKMNQRPTRWPWWLEILPWQQDETALMYFNIHFCVSPPSFFCFWYSLLPFNPLYPFLCFPLLVLWNSQLLQSFQVISLETTLTVLTAPCWLTLHSVATQYVCVCSLTFKFVVRHKRYFFSLFKVHL